MKERVRRLLTPPVRAYIRYAPFGRGKRAFWNRVVEPRFAWRPHRFVAPTVFGSRIAGDTSDIIQQYIYYFGVWEPHLTRWIERRLAPGDTFIDVGANIGYFSLLASKLVGDSGAVVAIEASPRTFGLLHGNLARNSAWNVRTVNVAAADREGMVSLFRGPDDNIGLTTVISDPRLAFECEVHAAPLSLLLTSEEVHNARLVKIDVEGAEWSVVAGMGPLLYAGRRDLEIIVEVTPEHLTPQGKGPEDLARVFQDAGFQAYRLENDYSPLSYLPPHAERRPERIRAPIQYQTDIVFSRQDSEQL